VAGNERLELRRAVTEDIETREMVGTDLVQAIPLVGAADPIEDVTWLAGVLGANGVVAVLEIQTTAIPVLASLKPKMRQCLMAHCWKCEQSCINMRGQSAFQLQRTSGR
jgi:hypothetical protein